MIFELLILPSRQICSSNTQASYILLELILGTLALYLF